MTSSDINETGQAANPRPFELTHVIPRDQPESVHELTAALYQPFQVDGGSVHLAGCSIEPVPVVQTVNQNYRFLGGDELDHDLAQSLGVIKTQPCDEPPPHMQQSHVQRLISDQLDHLDRKSLLFSGGREGVTLIWCNRVQGQLMVEIGESTETISFLLWAKRLVDGLDQCPPFHCPQTGRESYHIAADDEGTIATADSIEVCPESGRRLISTKLIPCQISNRRVDPQRLMQCSISGRQFLKRLAADCRQCRNLVDPDTVRRGKCRGCRSWQHVPSHASPVSEICRRWPELSQAKGFKVARTTNTVLLAFRLDGQKWTATFDSKDFDLHGISTFRGWFKPWVRCQKTDWPDWR